MNDDATIKSNIKKIRSEIGDDVKIVLATKTVPYQAVKTAYETGEVFAVGENKVQELLEKFVEGDGINRHFIGRLQTNKVKYLIGKVSLIHSVDRAELLKEIDRQSAKHGVVTDVLVEVNSGAEESKGGVLPDEVLDFCESVGEYKNVRLRGLMAVAPRVEDPSENEALFRKINAIFGKLRSQNPEADILSAGMSADYLVAVGCGANMIRPGSAVFGNRVYANSETGE